MSYLKILVLGLIFYSAVTVATTKTYEFHYKVTVAAPETGAKVLQMWLPLPPTDSEQKVVSEVIRAQAKYKVTEEPKYKNRMAYLELPVKETSFPFEVETVLKVERQEAKATTKDWDPGFYKKTDKRGPAKGLIEKMARAQTKGIQSDEEKIKKLYEYVTTTMTYNKDGTGWGQGDAIWACQNKRGNCTDFHSLLIAMARSQNIPGRFEIGFPIPEQGGVVPGYHCWAWIYSKQNQQWWPADSSEAKKAGKMFEYLGYIPNNRIRFTAGRDINLVPRQTSESLNFFIYPYLEVDGKPSDKYSKEFSVKVL